MISVYACLIGEHPVFDLRYFVFRCFCFVFFFLREFGFPELLTKMIVKRKSNKLKQNVDMLLNKALRYIISFFDIVYIMFFEIL